MAVACTCCFCSSTPQKLEELKRSQEEELEDRLDAGVKRILAANRRLAEELRLHVTVRQATSRLSSEEALWQTTSLPSCLNLNSSSWLG
jgi:hypothetical protein